MCSHHSLLISTSMSTGITALTTVLLAVDIKMKSSKVARKESGKPGNLAKRNHDCEQQKEEEEES